MAEVHETLYKSESLKDVELQEYLNSVAETALETMTTNNEEVRLVVNDREDSINVDLEKAVPIGLVVNELVSYAIQHGPLQNEELTLQLRLEVSPESTLRIHVKESGPGIPGDLDSDRSDTLGVRLVRSLFMYQLDGKFNWQNDPGPHFILTLPFRPRKTRPSPDPTGRICVLGV